MCGPESAPLGAPSLGAALNGMDSASFTQGARAEEARKDVEIWLSELDETLSRRGAANSIDFVSTGLWSCLSIGGKV